jgi:hypothetical protein
LICRVGTRGRRACWVQLSLVARPAACRGSFFVSVRWHGRSGGLGGGLARERAEEMKESRSAWARLDPLRRAGFSCVGRIFTCVKRASGQQGHGQTARAADTTCGRHGCLPYGVGRAGLQWRLVDTIAA